MKTKWAEALLLGTLLLPIPAIADDDTPPPIPPAVQIYQGGDAVQDGTQYLAHITYTKDDPDTVTDFYRRTLGSEPVKGRTFYLGDNDAGPVSDESGPVYLTVLSPADSGDNFISESDLFLPLEGRIRASRMYGQGDKQNDRKLQELKNKYAHLANKWYPKLDERAKLNERNSGANAGKTAKGNNFAAQQEANQQRIMQLMSEGRTAEATALARQSGGQGVNYQNNMMSTGGDDFETWESCFQELDRNDYRVMVVVKRMFGHFTPATANENKQNGKKSSSKSSGISNRFKDMGTDKLKGMFGF